ncbi:hypothetical protein cyc_05416 [Cyclospora cayetanensis]|uniref:Uncharacterized protein n=1 Tax=Cyclospora cayetanensis TaxID=88456 RepID=A0A1D3D7I6_9EIME|nr:hypothetical protein cyc_05416 [Cyclospora cayetanensis]
MVAQYTGALFLLQLHHTGYQEATEAAAAAEVQLALSVANTEAALIIRANTSTVGDIRDGGETGSTGDKDVQGSAASAGG